MSDTPINERFLAILEAICTQVMRRFAVAHVFLHRKHGNSSVWIYQLVALLLSIPVFHCSNLAFKVAYTLNHRRLRHICREQGLLGVNDDLVQLDCLPLNLSHRMKAQEALANIGNRLQAIDGGDKFSVFIAMPRSKGRFEASRPRAVDATARGIIPNNLHIRKLNGIIGAAEGGSEAGMASGKGLPAPLTKWPIKHSLNRMEP